MPHRGSRVGHLAAGGALCFLPTQEEPKRQRHQTARNVPGSSSLLPKGTRRQQTWVPNANDPKVHIGRSGCALRACQPPIRGQVCFPQRPEKRPGQPCTTAGTQTRAPLKGAPQTRGLTPTPGRPQGSRLPPAEADGTRNVPGGRREGELHVLSWGRPWALRALSEREGSRSVCFQLVLLLIISSKENMPRESGTSLY